MTYSNMLRFWGKNGRTLLKTRGRIMSVLNKSIQANHSSCIGTVCNNSQQLSHMIIKRRHGVVLYNILGQIIIILPWHRSHTGNVRVNQIYFSDSLEQEFRKYAVVVENELPLSAYWSNLCQVLRVPERICEGCIGFWKLNLQCTRLSRCVYVKFAI
jgi:hypothetical protein